MSNQDQPFVEAGELLRIKEADYLYGAGVLVLRVTRVGADAALLPRLEWVRLDGVEVRPDGRDGPERQVLVRVAALVGGTSGRSGLPARAHSKLVE